MVAGLHVPVLPLVEVVGKVGGTEFWQRGPIGVKIVGSGGSMVMLIVAVVAHCPASAVKV